MKNNLIKILIFIVLMTGFGCWNSEEYMITGIDLKSAKDDGFDYIETDTFRSGISFIIKENHELISNLIRKISFVSECRATSISFKYSNSIIIDSLVLCFNKDIFYINDTIKANTNILKNKIINGEKQINVFEVKRGVPKYIVIDFNKEMANNFRIDSNKCLVYLKAITTDNLSFIDSTNIIIDLKK